MLLVKENRSMLYEEIKEYFEYLEQDWGGVTYGAATLKRDTAEWNAARW
jgi:hypothetical protein